MYLALSYAKDLREFASLIKLSTSKKFEDTSEKEELIVQINKMYLQLTSSQNGDEFVKELLS